MNRNDDTPFGFGSREWLGDTPASEPHPDPEDERNRLNPNARSLDDPVFPDAPRREVVRSVTRVHHEVAGLYRPNGETHGPVLALPPEDEL